MKTSLRYSSSQPLVYRIDANDRISFVNAAWQEWAGQNNGEAVLSAHILGRELWSCIDDAMVRHVYHRLIALARGGTPIRFDYRCDSPRHRRVFEMLIHLVEGGEVEFVSTLVQEESRDTVALLEIRQVRDERLLAICSWCQRVRTPEGGWTEIEDLVRRFRLLESERFPQITHGMCPFCAERMEKIAGG